MQRDPGIYREKPVWLDVGDEDPFRGVDQQVAERLRAGGANVRFHTRPGGHDDSYWWSHLDEYMDFYADSLAKC